MVTNLDDKFYVRCVSTKSLNIESDKIIGKAKNNYTINFNRNMLENGFASNQQTIQSIENNSSVQKVEKVEGFRGLM